LSELVRLVKEMPLPRKVRVEAGPWEPERFFEMSKGLENAPERGARCIRCYGMRLEDTARVAGDMGTDFFATTLTLSPLKDSKVINALGEIISDKAAEAAQADRLKMTGTDGMIPMGTQHDNETEIVTLAELSEKLKANDWGRADLKDPGKYVPGAARYLDTDFKKNGGYQRSIELSREYGLYRQNYCGCLFSRIQRMEKESREE